MKKIFCSVLMLGALVVNAQKNKVDTKPKATPVKTNTAAPSVALKNLRDSASYALGVNIARNLKLQGMGSIDANLVYKGLNDGLQNKTTALPEVVAMECVNQFVQKQNGEKSKGEKDKGKKFMAENAKKPGVKTMPGGWQYEVLKESTSVEKPQPTDKVKVHYHGTLIDGTVFDSSVDRGEPISFGLNQVIKGWTMAVTQMPVGSKWRVVLPSDLAYGDNGSGDKIKPGATLIFEIELLGIEK